VRRIWIRLAGLWAFLSPRCGGHEPAACIPQLQEAAELDGDDSRRFPAAPTSPEAASGDQGSRLQGNSSMAPRRIRKIGWSGFSRLHHQRPSV